MGSLHTRMGEQQSLKWDNCGVCGDAPERESHQAWGRIGGADLDLKGKTRFESSQKYSFVQIGGDLMHNYDTDNKSRSTAGLMGSYGRSKSDFNDRSRTIEGLDTYTGKLDSTQWALGGYYTRYADNGSYMDFVGQISDIKNEFKDILGVNADQKGTGLGLSVEAGRPWQINDSQWLIEPQGQLSYQRNKYKAFSDAFASVDGYSAESLVARLGARLSWNDRASAAQGSDGQRNRTNSFYVTANLLKNLIKQDAVTIGSTAVKDEVNHKPWAEIGIGGQTALGQSTYLYGNINYQRSLSGKSREGSSGNIGVRVSW